MNLADMAAWYATIACPVFPLWWATDGRCACPEADKCKSPAKHPLVRRGVTEATADQPTITAWWQRWPSANVGLAVGAAGLGVIDVDPRHDGDASLDQLADVCAARGVDILDTLTARTGSGGRHLVYRAPDGGVKNSARSFGLPGLDTRGRGGYIVAAPSVHASGGQYEWMNELAPAPWPSLLTRIMEPPSRPPDPNTRPARNVGVDRQARYVEAAINAECDRLAAMTQPNSGRNAELNRSACKLGGLVACGYTTVADVGRALLWATSGWEISGHTERSRRKTIMSGLTAGQRRPRPIVDRTGVTA